MHRAFVPIAALLALICVLDRASAAADAPKPIATAIVDLDYVDTSGEARDQTQTHERLVQGFVALPGA